MSIEGLILLSLALGVGAWLFFLWTVKSGQYEDPEGPKYRMLDEEDLDSKSLSPTGGEGKGEGAAPKPPQIP